MMGSTTAMLGSVSRQGASQAGQGDGGNSDAAGFLAALGATPTTGPAPTGKTVQAAPPGADDAEADATPPDMAAVLAAMLQAALPTAAAANAAATAGTDPAAGTGNGQTVAAATATGDPHSAAAGAADGRNLLASLRAADLNAGTTTDQQGAAASTGAADDGAGANPAASGAPIVASAPGLRQLLQLLTPAQAGAAVADAGIDKPGIKQAQGVGQTPAATAASIALSASTLQIAAAAPAAANPQLAQSHSNNEPSSPAASVTLAADATAASANLTAPAHQAQAAAPMPDPTLHAPVGTPRWADELGSRVALMSLTGRHEGSLNLTPEHLGPLEVRVSVDQNTANVWFGAQHADTRAALAEAMPRLRELLAGAGLTLGQANVSQQAPRQGSQAAATQRQSGLAAGSAVEGVAATPAIARRIALGLVDTYA